MTFNGKLLIIWIPQTICYGWLCSYISFRPMAKLQFFKTGVPANRYSCRWYAVCFQSFILLKVSLFKVCGCKKKYFNTGHSGTWVAVFRQTFSLNSVSDRTEIKFPFPFPVSGALTPLRTFPLIFCKNTEQRLQPCKLAVFEYRSTTSLKWPLMSLMSRARPNYVCIKSGEEKNLKQAGLVQITGSDTTFSFAFYPHNFIVC